MGIHIEQAPHPLESARLAITPRITRVLARAAIVFLVLLPIALIFIPWQQTVHANGRAIAFNPVERPQFVVSPIEGRVKKWHVNEGDRLKAGDLMVEMIDNDALLIERLQDEEQAIQSQVTFSVQRVQEVSTRTTNIDLARQLQVGQQEDFVFAEERVIEALGLEVLAADARLVRADITFKRVEKQFKNIGKDGQAAPLVSEQEFDNARQEQVIADKSKAALTKRLDSNIRRLEGAKKRVGEIEKVAQAQLNSERANLNQALESEQNYRRTLLGMQSRIARQRQQTIFSPTDGTVFRILQNGEAGGQLVRPGERLGIIVPDIRDRKRTSVAVAAEVGSAFGLFAVAPFTGPALPANLMTTIGKPGAIASLTRDEHPGIVCELLLDGNDFPLVQDGDPVILQFEGWPAVQFVAFPETAAGTFGGRVYLRDPTADDRGQFRILVEPDPTGRPWPEQDLLRQGVRAQGWVMLKRVMLGQELWRQLNGFPPARAIKTKDGAAPLGPVQKR